MRRISLLAGLPRYRQVAADLYEQIRSGHYPPGTALPTEPQLADDYGLSRGTIRQALGLLRQQGILDVVQGSGHYVKPRPQPQPVSLPTRADIEGTPGQAPPMHEIGFAPVPADIAAVFQEDPGSYSLLRRRRMRHTTTGLPLRRDSVYIWQGDLRPELYDQLMTPGPIPHLPGLVEHATGKPVKRTTTTTTTTTTARLPAPEEAAEFQIADSAPLLVVLLAGWDAHDLAVWAAESVWPAERVALVETQTHRPRARRARPEPG
jgi:DNA-binding GntR family transcriptional regulator